jgi:DNA-binding XRE family transcriptional regulator
MPQRKKITDAIEIIHRRYFEGHPERLAMLEEARANDEVARKIYELRTRARLTQRQLAKMIGTTASVICRLEDADYEGHAKPHCGGAEQTREDRFCTAAEKTKVCVNRPFGKSLTRDGTSQLRFECSPPSSSSATAGSPPTPTRKPSPPRRGIRRPPSGST